MKRVKKKIAIRTLGFPNANIFEQILKEDPLTYHLMII